MKNEVELNQDILSLTMKIKEKYPELSKYISEMPVKTSDSADNTNSTKSLSEYYESLDALLRNYIPNHKSVSTTTEKISTF